MKKELLVTLLKKDISELDQMTEGFSELDFFPVALLNLAKDKADNIKKCLNELSELSKMKKQCSENVAPVPPTPVVLAPEVAVQMSIVEEVKANVENAEVSTGEESEAEVPATIEPETEEIIAPEAAVAEVADDDDFEDEIEDGIMDEEDAEEYAEEEEEVAEEEAATDEKLEFVAPLTRNDQLQNQKIDDIKQAISLGDRFLFQRELFRNSGELLSKTITAINACRTFDDAQKYLKKKFQWDYEHPTTERFMQIVARKFD